MARSLRRSRGRGLTTDGQIQLQGLNNSALNPAKSMRSRKDRRLWSSLIVANRRCAERRKIGHVPATSQSLDQKDAGVHAAPQNVDGIPFVGEFGRLRGDDLEVGVDAAFVTIRKKLKGILG